MILNERQHRVTRAKATELEQRVGELSRTSTTKPEPKREMLLDAVRGQLEDLQRELREYEAFAAGAIPITPVESLQELPLALIRARIARGWTQSRLAEALAVPEQQVQRDEANRYRGAALDRLQRIADVLGVRIAGAAALPEQDGRLESSPRWRLPSLVMLIREVRRAHGRPLSGRFELHKLALEFEEQVRRELGWSVFRFEPYLYGAFDARLDDDLDFLIQEGLLASRSARKSRAREELFSAKTSPSAIEPAPKAEAWLRRFLVNEKLATPETKHKVLAVAARVASEYGGLGPTELVQQSYERHPYSTRRSVIRDRVLHRRKRTR